MFAVRNTIDVKVLFIIHLKPGNYIQSYSLKPLKGCKFSN